MSQGEDIQETYVESAGRVLAVLKAVRAILHAEQPIDADDDRATLQELHDARESTDKTPMVRVANFIMDSAFYTQLLDEYIETREAHAELEIELGTLEKELVVPAFNSCTPDELKESVGKWCAACNKASQRLPEFDSRLRSKRSKAFRAKVWESLRRVVGEVQTMTTNGSLSTDDSDAALCIHSALDDVLENVGCRFAKIRETEFLASAREMARSSHTSADTARKLGILTAALEAAAEAISTDKGFKCKEFRKGVESALDNIGACEPNAKQKEHLANLINHDLKCPDLDLKNRRSSWGSIHPCTSRRPRFWRITRRYSL